MLMRSTWARAGVMYATTTRRPRSDAARRAGLRSRDLGSSRTGNVPRLSPILPEAHCRSISYHSRVASADRAGLATPCTPDYTGISNLEKGAGRRPENRVRTKRRAHHRPSSLVRRRRARARRAGGTRLRRAQAAGPGQIFRRARRPYAPEQPGQAPGFGDATIVQATAAGLRPQPDAIDPTCAPASITPGKPL